MDIFSTAGFILVINYVRMEVTLVGSSWVVVAGGQTGVDFIPMLFCGKPSPCLAGARARFNATPPRDPPGPTNANNQQHLKGQIRTTTT